MIAELSVLANLYARVFEKVIHHACAPDGDHPVRRESAPVGIALAREEAERAIQTVARAASPHQGEEVDRG